MFWAPLQRSIFHDSAFSAQLGITSLSDNGMSVSQKAPSFTPESGLASLHESQPHAPSTISSPCDCYP